MQDEVPVAVDPPADPDPFDPIRASVRAWLAEAWDPELTVREWWARLADSGWGFPQWPRQWFGLGLSDVEAAVVHDELARAGVLGPPAGAGPSMGATVLFAYGSEEQRRRWLPAIARGEEHWCQFFSEPGAGSDLASVQARAIRDGDEWIVNGQKVWNSGTLVADRGLLIVRTDLDAPKHRGMSFFVIDVDQPGLDIRPIRQMNGRSEFNETFFTDARVSDAALIGGLNEGFRVAMTTLTMERAAFAGGGARQLVTAAAGVKAGDLDVPVREVLGREHTEDLGAANTLPYGSPQRIIDLARTFDRTTDVVLRQRIAAIYAASEALRFTGLRARTAAQSGRDPGPESSIAYLGGVRLVRRYRDLASEIGGAATTLSGPDAPEEGALALTVTTAPCHGIQGGTEQIQLNIIGERILGLPKEPQPDRDIPFREVGIGTHRR
jgi:alkylation response protein AidB-like acyl-CoA dehydrogenase